MMLAYDAAIKIIISVFVLEFTIKPPLNKLHFKPLFYNSITNLKHFKLMIKNAKNNGTDIATNASKLMNENVLSSRDGLSNSYITQHPLTQFHNKGKILYVLYGCFYL